ncbi:PDZ domain-containing protein [Kamptonema cortianum]|nr:PDZ domain-containing protein [Geitlerinema splendidum]MDK3156184.1 PDZ domain-containing protein [Kamptonema cortianum]
MQLAPPMAAPVDEVMAKNWSAVQQSLAVLPDIHGQPFGLAVLIDEQGHFVAHVSSLVYEPLTAKMMDGTVVKLGRIGYDKETRLVLLGAHDWKPNGRKAIPVSQAPQPGKVMLATPNGPVRAQMVSTNRPGVFAPSQRFVPLAEIQLEERDFPLGGALVFDSKAQLAGILGAILAPIQTSPSAAKTVQDGVGASGGAGGGFSFTEASRAANQFGPRGLTVGYALGPKVLERVVSGFTSPSHEVRHPSVGIFFQSLEPGNRIQIIDVTPDGPAALAGIRKGDIVLKANGKPLISPVEFASFLFEQNPGNFIQLLVRRGDNEIAIEIKVAAQDNLVSSVIGSQSCGLFN